MLFEQIGYTNEGMASARVRKGKEGAMKKFNVMFLLGCALVGTARTGVSDSKKAHLSNEWYPSDPEKLKKKLKELDDEAESLYSAQVSGVRALIVPHAGLSYSGSLAAACFRLLDKKKVRRIVLLGPSHLPFRGVILPSYSSYRLSSGVLPIDARVVRELALEGAPFTLIAETKKDPHYKEHSLEVELPLIQEYTPRAKIVPIIVGSIEPQDVKKVSRALKKYLDKETVVVVSTDFTHYGPRFDNVPFKVDQTTPLRIRALDNGLLQPIFNRSLSQFLSHLSASESTMCGKNPLSVLLGLFEEGVFEKEVPYLIGYDTSTTKKADDHKNSVSYVGMAFGKPHLGPVPMLTGYERRALVDLAYSVMENKLTGDIDQNLLLPLMTPNLQKPSRLFMALYKKTDPSFVNHHTGKQCEGETCESLYKAVMAEAEKGMSSFEKIKMTVADLRDVEIQISLITTEKAPTTKTRKTIIAQSVHTTGMHYC